MAAFFGRFHPLLVHLPIGILFLAFIFEWMSYYPRYKQLRIAVRPALFWGALSAVAAAISGYFLSQEGGYDERLLGLHRNTGIATAVFAVLILIIRKSIITFFDDKRKRKLVRIFLFIPLIGILSLAGHFGGSLTHGEDYLFAAATDVSGDVQTQIKITSMESADSAVLYTDVIAPILNARCYACHSSAKQKGQLRLDDIKLIEKGGKHGPVLDKSIPDSSELYVRLIVPVEEEEHMPPKEKPQMSSAEIALVQAWVQEGANFNQRIGTYKHQARIKGYLTSLLSSSTVVSMLPGKEVHAAPDEALEKIRLQGIVVIPVGASTNYLSASFINDRSADDQKLEILLPIRDQLLWLNAGRTKISDQGIQSIGKLSQLTQVNLEYTEISDEGIQGLKPLSELTSLNLVGTKVGDKGIEKLSSLKKLKRLYLYQTKVTPEGTRALLKILPGLKIDTGSYILPKLPTDTIVFKGPGL